MTKKIYLKKNEERRIRTGHLWIFSNEIEKPNTEVENGDIVEVFDSRKNCVGSGFFNKNSLIAVRLLSKTSIDDFYEFAKKKILNAYQLRKTFYPSRESFRLLFSESDFMPGLIIDKYNSTFVLQVYSFGMQRNIEIISKILQEELGAENIFTKNEDYFRRLEGLPEEDEILHGEMKEEIVNDGAINYKINFEKGHKTGFYFDQSDNRFFIEKIVSGKSVIDAFCNSGGFGLHAARAGAASVTFVDSSSLEIENSQNNFELNNLKCESDFVANDVFEFFNKYLSNNKKFDVVMIDPPAFAKNKKSLPTAKKGYEKLNKLAIQLTNSNGFLVTSSCSYHLNEKDFIQIVNAAAEKAGKHLQFIHFNQASLDHPKLPAMSETSYLKFAVFKVIE